MDKSFELKYIFFDIGYTLVNEERVWERRCKEQAEKSEARKLGLTSGDIYNEIIRASLAYSPQYRTVVNKYGFSDVAPYRWELEYLYDDAVKVLEYLSEKYTLGIIANQADGLRARLKALQIEHFFKQSFHHGIINVRNRTNVYFRLLYGKLDVRRLML